jgi:hypothetical protein
MLVAPLAEWSLMTNHNYINNIYCEFVTVIEVHVANCVPRKAVATGPKVSKLH